MISIKTENSADRFAKKQNSFNVKHIDTGYHISEENWSHKKRFLDDYEIIFVSKGTLYLQVNDKHHVLSENDILILPPYVTICSYDKSESPTSFYWVRFAADNFSEFKITSDCFKIQNPYEYIKLFKELIHITSSTVYPPYTADIIVALMLSYLAAGCKSNVQRNRVDVARISEWIDEKINANVTVELVSKTFNYNKDYLCKVFKAEIGTTIKEYIIFKQMKKAKDLLLTSDYSIKQISQILKYGNTNLFIKFFKYHEKISPSKFREIMRG